MTFSSPSSAKVLEEIIVEAELDVLNAALANRGVSADRIVSVIELPPNLLIDPSPRRLRIFYRSVP